MQSLYNRVVPLGVHAQKNSDVGIHDSRDSGEFLHLFYDKVDETPKSRVFLQSDGGTYTEEVGNDLVEEITAIPWLASKSSFLAIFGDIGKTQSM